MGMQKKRTDIPDMQNWKFASQDVFNGMLIQNLNASFAYSASIHHINSVLKLTVIRNLQTLK